MIERRQGTVVYKYSEFSLGGGDPLSASGSHSLKVDLSGICIPEEIPLRRRMPLPPEKRSRRYEASFDSRTLIYDAFWKDDRIVLICPRLLNLWPVLRDGLRLNGKAVSVRRRRNLRFERLELRARVSSEQSTSLKLDLHGRRLPVAVHEDLSPLFAGLRGIVTMVKDTPHDWIVDWARWHAETQGTEALVLYDNATTTFDMTETAARLERDTGLKRIAIVSAPFPYGGPAGGRFVTPAKFLQVAMLNLARERFFGSARSVLSVDLDEFMKPMQERTIHELAEDSPLGVVHFFGTWAFAEENQGPAPQRAHRLTIPGGGVRRKAKWCAVPGRRAGRFAWAVHRPGGVFYPLTRVAAGYWHFRSTTTGWSRSPITSAQHTRHDPELAGALRRVFS